MFPHPGISQDFSIAKVLAMSQKLLNLGILMEIHAHFNSTLNTTFLTVRFFPALKVPSPKIKGSSPKLIYD